MSDNREHPYVPTLKERLAAGRVDRREFLRTATLLGISAGAAYAFADKLAGGPSVALAQTAAMPKGGALRIAALVNEVKSPHTFFRLEQSNVVRQAGGGRDRREGRQGPGEKVDAPLGRQRDRKDRRAHRAAECEATASRRARGPLRLSDGDPRP